MSFIEPRSAVSTERPCKVDSADNPRCYSHSTGSEYVLTIEFGSSPRPGVMAESTHTASCPKAAARCGTQQLAVDLAYEGIIGESNGPAI